MKIKLKAVKVVDKASKFNGEVVDILIDNGFITDIAEAISEKTDKTYDKPGSAVSTGWCDMRVHNTQPGFEHKEDLQSLNAAALAGGYTDIVLLPNTQPIAQSKEMVAYVKNLGTAGPVNFWPLAAATHNCEGKDINEYIDLHKNGAIAFSDGVHTIDRPEILQKVLQYLQQIDGILLNHPTLNSLNAYGQMNESLHSNLLGLKGMPAYAEANAIQQHLDILDYLGNKSKVHFSLLSTAAGVQKVREAKKKGYKISCDVAAHHLAFTEEKLGTFDSNYKVMPPLRTEADREALWAGLLDGTIDALVSDHCPQDAESKNLEFDLADFGLIGLETSFAVLCKFNKALNYNTMIEKLSTNPRKILNLPKISIEVGQPAQLTLFQTGTKWTPTAANTKSMARNSAFYGIELIGKAQAIVNKGMLYAAQ